MADPQGPDTPALLAEGMNHDTRVPCQPHSLPTPQPLYSDFYLLEIFIFFKETMVYYDFVLLGRASCKVRLSA